MSIADLNPFLSQFPLEMNRFRSNIYIHIYIYTYIYIYKRIESGYAIAKLKETFVDCLLQRLTADFQKN